MLDHLLGLVDPSLLSRSGRIFYSGRRAFAGPCDLYILGLNPGGDPTDGLHDTVAQNIADAKARATEDWSAYRDEAWEGRAAGGYGMQPRVLHLLARLGRDPAQVPASNVIFVRTARERGLSKLEKQSLLRTCWPVHQAVIEGLGVRTILCLGGTAGRWVRRATGADQEIDRFREANGRGWVSVAHRNAAGLAVVSLSHPSIADWRVTTTDPTPLVARVMAASSEASRS